MAKCVIFCAGGFDALAEKLEKDDYIIAADGGYAHLQKAGITPNAVLGDFDSLGYTPDNAAVFPVEKDDTDAMLAVRHGLKLGYREFVLYGSLDGPRLDHTLANLQVLAFLAQHNAKGYLVGNEHIVTLVKDGTLRFPREAEGIVSVFCLGQDATGVNIRGLKYPLENGTLTAAFPLGVSNHFTGRPARITAHAGLVLALWDRKNGLGVRHADL